MTHDYLHRKHKIHYSFVDNKDGTFAPIAMVFDVGPDSWPVPIPAHFVFREQQAALDHALVQAIAAVNSKIDG